MPISSYTWVFSMSLGSYKLSGSYRKSLKRFFCKRMTVSGLTTTRAGRQFDRTLVSGFTVEDECSG